MTFLLFSFSACLFGIIILHSYVTPTQAHPLDIPSFPSSSLPSLPLSSREGTCGFQGNPDVYGAGIRIGIYCQTLAVWTSKYFLLSQAHVLRDNVTVFSTALLSVAIVFAVHKSSTYAIEEFLVLTILSWTCSTGVRSRSSYSSTTFKNRALRVGFTEWFDVAALGLHAWFWFWALEREFLQTPCGTKVFFFAEVDVGGWYKHLVQVKVILGLIDHVYDGAFRFVGLWSHGAVRGQKEVTDAVVRFEGWRKMERRHGEAEEIGDKRGNELVRDRADSTPFCRAGTDSAVYESLKLGLRRGGRRSKTWDPHATFVQDDNGQSGSALEQVDTAVEIEQTGLVLIPLFEEIYRSEKFLADCTAAGPASQFQTRHPHIYTLVQRLSLVPRPIKADDYAQADFDTRSAPPSYRTCLAAISKAIITFRFPHRAGALTTHLVRAKMLDIINGPPQICHALNYKFTPTESAPGPLALALASKYQLAQLPSLNKGHKWVQAILDMTIHIFLMIQIELTIVWNNITGLGGLGNVGQLVPFIIGVGGLGLILARGAEDWWVQWRNRKSGIEYEGGNDEDGVEEAPKTPAERFVEVYREWKEIYESKTERRGIVEAKTED
ncbi:hypothetical protein BDV96DRAFT_644533 [Lophiotrema nucula]|uniref:Uncharacterized protein n=1 Tax=Lophiotrema nucula TaxID=690887 RepID=A0A6A5ZC88_9PLEO|nr:hypothetical protein BDV96DRAFT_644533 [Lophiotrema nucula]